MNIYKTNLHVLRDLKSTKLNAYKNVDFLGKHEKFMPTKINDFKVCKLFEPETKILKMGSILYALQC